MAKLSIAREEGKLTEQCDIVERQLDNTLAFLKQAAGEKPEYLENAARDLSYSLARLYAGGSNAGGSNVGGSNAGGSNVGGSNAGGSNAGGSNAGGSNAGGSNAG